MPGQNRAMADTGLYKDSRTKTGGYDHAVELPGCLCTIVPNQTPAQISTSFVHIRQTRSQKRLVKHRYALNMPEERYLVQFV